MLFMTGDAGAGSVSNREAETTRQTMASRKVIGPNRSRSPKLVEARLPSVFSARNAVTTQEPTLIYAGIGVSPTSPARRRMTYMNKPRMTTATRLATRSAPVNSDWRPPQAIEIGNDFESDMDRRATYAYTVHRDLHWFVGKVDAVVAIHPYAQRPPLSTGMMDELGHARDAGWLLEVERHVDLDRVSGRPVDQHALALKKMLPGYSAITG